MPESVKESLGESLAVETPNDTRVLNALLSDQFAGKLETLAKAKGDTNLVGIITARTEDYRQKPKSN